MIAVSGVTAITPNPGRNSWAGWRRCFSPSDELSLDSGGPVALSSSGPLVTELMRERRASAAGVQDLLAHPAAPAGDEAGCLETVPASTRLNVKRAEALHGVSHDASSRAALPRMCSATASTPSPSDGAGSAPH